MNLILPVEIKIFEDVEWVSACAQLIWEEIKNSCREKGYCNIVLTGGRSAESIYRKWRDLYITKKEKLNVYFGDERCVPSNDLDSNYRMVVDSMVNKETQENISIFPILGDADNKENEAARYEAVLPLEIDILLLSIGEDGHIASIFPKSEAVFEKARRMMVINGPKKPYERISITPNVIHSAGKIFCFGQGSAKGKALALTFAIETDIFLVPAKIAKNGIWLLDRSAEEVMIQNNTVQKIK